MVHFKSYSLLTLVSLLFSNITCKEAAATSLQCTSTFGRVMGSDGKPDYSFTCKCTASNHYTSVQNQCSYSGETPNTECSSTTESSSPEKDIKLNIIKCNFDNVTTDVNVWDHIKHVKLPLKCAGFGTSGLQCEGFTNVL